MTRQIKFAQAINEALDLCMAKDESVYLMGLGVPDPKGIFGTTLELQQKYGCNRVMDMPTSESGMTGVALGSALVGMRPVMVHQRVEFATLAVEQIVNQAAKWHYMYGGQGSVPLVIRLIVGRGWGQGPQHSQVLHSWFAHVPGLKVVLPATASDAKGLLISAIEDNNPVIFFEHRWLHNVTGNVPEGLYRTPIGKAKVLREGTDVTIAAVSYMVLESLRAAEMLAAEGIKAEVIDLRSARPLDEETLLESVRRTGRLAVADIGWKFAGFGSEVVAKVTEELFRELKTAPVRLASLDGPIPSTPALARYYYPRAIQIFASVMQMMGQKVDLKALDTDFERPTLLDIPDKSFTGPF